MRNLKRALSMALASVMLLGMMVVGTSADFSDVKDAHNEEAIAVMEAAGIMIGSDGKFNPDQKVTRNEAAVVITNLLGLKAADYAGTSPFTDVPAWAEPYVAAVYANGITAGISATEFGGANEVTTAQFSLWLMKALGYFQYQADFGDDWQMATVKQASKIELAKGVAAGATAALTRNEVAKLVLNALKSDVVDFTGTVGSNITTSDGTSIAIGYRGEYDPVVESTDNYNFAAAGTDARKYQQLAEKLFDNDLRVTTNNEDSFGRPANRWTFKAKEIGVFAKDPTVVYVDGVKSSAIYADLGLSSNKTASYTVDGTGTGSWLIGKNQSVKTTAATGGIPGVVTGTTVEVFYDVDADTVEICAYNTYVGVVSAVYDDYISITAKTGGHNGNFDTTGFAMDDIVLYTWDGSEIKSVEKAEKAGTIEVESFTASKLNGAYTYNGYHYDDTAIELDSKYDLYTDKNGFVVYTELNEGGMNYLFVTDETYTVNGFTQTKWTLKVTFADGTTATINTDNKVSDGSLKNKWCTYAVEDGVYTLFAKTTKPGSGAVENGVAATTLGDNCYADDNTVFVVYNTTSASYKVYVGFKNVPDITATASYVYENADNLAKYVYVTAPNSQITSADAGLIYVTKASKGAFTTDNNGEYYTYTALIDGKVVTLKFAESVTATNVAGGVLSADAKLASVAYNGKGIVTSATDYSAPTGKSVISGTATGAYKNGIAILGSTGYAADEDVVVYYIDGDGKFTTGSFTGIQSDDNDTWYAVLDGSKVEALYITKVGVSTPAVAASISGNAITVNVSNYASDGTMTISCTVTGGATAAISETLETNGQATITLTGNGTSGYVTIKVTNTVTNVGSAYAEYVVAYSIPVPQA